MTLPSVFPQRSGNPGVELRRPGHLVVIESKHTRHISDLLIYLQGLLQLCQDGDILGKLGSPPGYGPGTSRNPKIKDHSSTLFFHLLLCLLLPVSGTLSSWKWALTRCWGAGVAPVQQDAADIELLAPQVQVSPIKLLCCGEKKHSL